ADAPVAIEVFLGSPHFRIVGVSGGILYIKIDASKLIVFSQDITNLSPDLLSIRACLFERHPIRGRRITCKGVSLFPGRFPTVYVSITGIGIAPLRATSKLNW